MKRTLTIAVATLIGLAGSPANAAGYLGARAEPLPPLRIGLGDTGYGLEPKEYTLETGKGYRLTVHSTGAVECILDMRDFLDNVWLRQAKAGEVEFLNAKLSVVELDDEGEFELTFVPVRPGQYPFACRGLEERGMKGIIRVE